jgi:hypothetical protein
MSDAAQPQKPLPPLPPVQPPNASFLLQLFLIPLVIVIIIVSVWLLFSWLAHMGTNPRDLVRDIGKVNDASWQRAYNLAELLRKPQYDELKDDPKLALELASTLQSLRATRPQRKKDVEVQADERGREKADAVYDNRLKLELFICRALGEFRTPAGIPALTAAAGPVDDPRAFIVREAALQSIAVQASVIDPQVMQQDDALMKTLLEASLERGTGGNLEEYNRVRSSAAFALGMVGGDEALERLAQMLDDGDPNVRYNAATGLARHGDTRALPVLGEMLDPNNTEALVDVEAKRDEDVSAGNAWKRALVLSNGIRAARQMFEKHPDADYSQLVQWLTDLENSDANARIKLDAKALRLEIRKAEAAAQPT